MKNAISSSLTPYGKKKNEMREHLIVIRQLGLSPFISHRTKLAGKIFFSAYSNVLIHNYIFYKLNR